MSLAPAVLLAALAFGAVTGDGRAYGEMDALYFHRDEPGKLQASIELLEAGLKGAARDPELLWRLGRSEMRLGETQSDRRTKGATFSRAEDHLRESVRLAPRVAVAHFWLGALFGREAQLRGPARSLFLIGPLKKEMRAVLEIEPNYGGAHQILGQLYSQLPRVLGGGRRKSLAEFELALEQSPDYAQNYAPLAQAYVAAGEKEKARAVLERLFALKETSDPAALPEELKRGRELESQLKQ